MSLSNKFSFLFLRPNILELRIIKIQNFMLVIEKNLFHFKV